VQLTAEQFGKAFIASGLSTAEDLKAIWSGLPPADRPKDGEAFARLLRRQGKLNEFQAEELLSGRNTPLVLGDYVLIDKIGAGGMGQVFKAEHRVMKRRVAVKLLPSSLTQDEAAIKRFQREVQAAARLSHPNIVAAYDASAQRGVWYLAMEYVEGRDLSALVRERGPLSIEQAVEFVVQAARGLAFAHAEHVIHRDIKPANMLVDKKGVVKILDMGLARFDGGDDGLTGTEQVMGTVDYMSPEQASNTKGVDGRADIYSLGCTLWFLLTGKKLYESDTMIGRLMAHRDSPLPSLVKARDDAPWPLEQIFHKMIAKRPQDRYPTMDEVVNALAPYAVGSSSNGVSGSSIGTTSTTSPELASFFKTVGPGTSGSQATAGVRSTASQVQTATGPLDATAAFGSADVGTDPKSEPTTKAAKSPSLNRRNQGGGRKKSPTKLIALGLCAVSLIAVLSVWIADRDDAVNEIASVATAEPGGAKLNSTAAATPVGLPPQIKKRSGSPEGTPADSEFQRWLTDVMRMPAEKRLEAVAEKLVELNPGFDGQYFHLTEKGAIKVFILNTDMITDLSPIRAFRELEDLGCGGTGKEQHRSPLNSLAPLEGLKLRRLDISHTEVVDLAALRGMPLEQLYCDWTYVGDLRPLTGMKLTRLRCSRCNIASLAPLRGMPLTDLHLGYNLFNDLSPLQGMPLRRLYINDLGLKDLSALAGMPLEELSCTGNRELPATGCDPIKSLKLLRVLRLNSTSLSEDECEPLAAALPNCQILWSSPEKGLINLGKPSPPSPTPPTSRLWNYRQVAEWVLDHGGKLWIGSNKDIKRREDLPPNDEPITVVTFANTPEIDDAEIDVMTRWPLTAFAFTKTSITDEGLRRLWLVQHSGSFGVMGQALTGEGLDAFAEAPIGTFVLDNAAFSRRGWLAAARVGSAVSWSLHNSNIDDDILRLIVTLHPEGRSYNVGRTRIGDRSCEAFRNNQSLTTFTLAETQVTDAGLVALAGCKNLTFLDLKQSQVTATGVAKLQKSLPNCKIEWDGSTTVNTPTERERSGE
jgi:serine/threonine protein kinase/Leucine-rich repeat (LRR) protein